MKRYSGHSIGIRHALGVGDALVTSRWRLGWWPRRRSSQSHISGFSRLSTPSARSRLLPPATFAESRSSRSPGPVAQLQRNPFAMTLKRDTLDGGGSFLYTSHPEPLIVVSCIRVEDPSA